MPEGKNLVGIYGKILKFGDCNAEIVFFVFRPFADIDRLDDGDPLRPSFGYFPFCWRILYEFKTSSGDKISEANPENPHVKPKLGMNQDSDDAFHLLLTGKFILDSIWSFVK